MNAAAAAPRSTPNPGSCRSARRVAPTPSRARARTSRATSANASPAYTPSCSRGLPPAGPLSLMPCPLPPALAAAPSRRLGA